MTTPKLSLLSAAIVVALAGLNISASEVDFSYTYGAQDFAQVGSGKAETYDVAILLSDPSLVGSKVTSVNVPFITSENVSNISVWASKELKIEKKVNIPDITSVSATCVDGSINVTFPKAVDVTEGGIYIGYTFTVDSKSEKTEKPVIVAGEPVADGLYMHTSRTYLKWKSYAYTMGHSSSITVTLDGDFQVNAMGIVSVEDPIAASGEEMSLAATLINHGSAPVSDIEYVVEGIGNDQPQTYTFDTPQKLYFGETLPVQFSFVAPIETREYPIEVKVTKVNGVDNFDKGKAQNASLLVINDLPVHKPLMEEYTGLWCGFCPRGYVGLERMNTLYPDDFVAISYHSGNGTKEPMEVTSDFPNYVAGFPAAYIDRVYDVDAYDGIDSKLYFGIESFWNSIRDQFTPAIVNGSAFEANDGTITVKSDISFVKTVDGTYKVAYVIVADGLTDPAWGQSNYYYDPKYNTGNFVPEMDVFVKGSSKVYGLVFNDVYAAGSNLNGEKSSLIENVVKDNIYTHEFSFGSDAGISLTKYDLFGNAKEVYAIIILLDENGAVVNTNKVLVENHQQTVGVNVVEASEAVSVEYYDLNGCRVENPSNGILVKVTTLENGMKVTDKVVME